MLERLIPCPRMDMNELVYLLGRHEKYESLLDEAWTVMPIGLSDRISMVHFIGEKSETRWCTLIMAADQKFLDLAGSLLQMIAKTQENIGEMLKIQKRQNEMNHQILQDTIGLQREVKSLLGAIGKGKEGGSAMGQYSKQPDKKWSRHEDSKKIE